jgi:hypothetical protein
MGVSAALLALASVTPAPAADEPLGRKPEASTRPLSDVPNASAIVARMWLPGHDEGYVPQGLAFSAGRLVLSTYRSTDPKQDRGPCRVFFIVPTSGTVEASLDLPASCGHAGGVAALKDGRIVVADTRVIFVLKDREVISSSRLTGELKGSFAGADTTHLWTGSYEQGAGKLWRLPLTALGSASLSEKDAVTILNAPSRMQGMAFDARGQLWVTVSGSRDGALLRLDPATGQLQARYAMPAGIEDIAFDDNGLLWAVSEAGSIRWSAWATHFPLIFAVDVARLR